MQFGMEPAHQGAYEHVVRPVFHGVSVGLREVFAEIQQKSYGC